MIDARAVLVLIGYAWLLIELLRFPVPSEASVYQLLFDADEPDEADQADDAGRDTPLARARLRSPGWKLVAYLLPTALGVSLFLIPPVAALWRPLLDFLVPLPGLQTRWAFWLGAVLVLTGRTVTFVSVLQVRRQKVRAGLQYAGLFRCSRNPGLVGMYLFYLGLCFLFPCLVLFLGLVPYVGNMHARVLLEESHLDSRFGVQYAEYKQRVPRYVFF